MQTTIGRNFKVSIFGGSHEPEIGVILEGLPISPSKVDMKELQAFLDRRAPGRDPLSTTRKESDVPILASTEPLTYIIENRNQHSSDYDDLAQVPRPGHADFPAYIKYRGSVSMTGGGPFSGRMTAPMCIAGGIAVQLLAQCGVHISARLVSVATCRTEASEKEIRSAIAKTAKRGDSLGGEIHALVTGLPSGLGGPMFDGLESFISPVVFAIPGVKGISFGSGFAAATMTGSQNNDSFKTDENRRVFTATNHAGGILGGMSTGMNLTMQVAFKPTPSIPSPQQSVDMSTGQAVTLRVSGRHDPCIALRAAPVVEAALAISILDAFLDPAAAVTPWSNDLSLNLPYAKKTDSLASFRKEIDNIDSKLLHLFKKRMDLSLKIARYKKESQIPILNSSREEEILSRVDNRLPRHLSGYGASFFKALFALSKDCQSRFFDQCREEEDK